MKILIVDDHVVVREGVRRLLSTMPDVEVVEAGNARDALTEFRKWQPAIVVLDINMDASSGLEFLQRLRAISKTAKVIMFTMHSEPGYVSRAMRAGAMGYVSKSAPADELLEAVKRVSAGETYIDRELAGAIGPEQAAGADPYDNLTNREVEILRLLGEGKSIAEMAATFGVAYKTVANSCSLLKVKLGLARTADLIRLSLERRDR
ncbi:MAG: response regulator transcription factor [Hyphomicrobium sp.]